MIAIGADVHKRTCTLAMQGEDGQLTMLPSMENTRENWLHRLGNRVCGPHQKLIC